MSMSFDRKPGVGPGTRPACRPLNAPTPVSFPVGTVGPVEGHPVPDMENVGMVKRGGYPPTTAKTQRAV